MRELENRVKRLEGHSIFLSTTNDNLSAIRFYQRRGYQFKKLHPGEFRNVLILKGYDPDTKVVGQNDIVIRDEIVFEKRVL